MMEWETEEDRLPNDHHPEGSNGTAEKRGRKRQREDAAGGASDAAALQAPVSPAEIAPHIKGEMFSTVGTELMELENSVEKFNAFLQNHEMFPYLSEFIQQFFDLSKRVKTRMQDLHTLYSFLVRLALRSFV
jgi:hypothetical protein